MKKISRVLVLLAAVTVLAVSCKTREKCPAYGQAEKTHQHNKG